jgi:hypothetical protein
MEGIIQAWGRILTGYSPCLSLEITRECPLRYRELNILLPHLAAMGIHVQLVTSAVRPIPEDWASIPRLSLVVSIDGLQPEHDERRKPATYDRILKHMNGHQVTVHCTVTRQQASREGYIEEFVRFWSDQPTTWRIWMSLYTPQVGEESAERLTAEDRKSVLRDLLVLRDRYPKLHLPKGAIEVYADPPRSPAECVFSRITTCLSADFDKPVTPCQFGGNPDCQSCGCLASAGLAAVGRHRLPGGLRLETLFDASLKVGAVMRRVRVGAANGH